MLVLCMPVISEAAGNGCGTQTRDQIHDQLMDQDRLQDQDQLKDGSCQAVLQESAFLGSGDCDGTHDQLRIRDQIRISEGIELKLQDQIRLKDKSCV